MVIFEFRFKCLVLLLLSGFLTSHTMALTDNIWNGAAGTDWLDGGNWSSSSPPTINDRIKIGSTADNPE